MCSMSCFAYTRSILTYLQSDSSDSDSDSEEESEEEAKVEVPSKKRKASEEVEESNKKSKSEESDESATLWVGNLGWSVDDNVLFEEFKTYPEIVGARVVTDKETGRSRGFGYVDFSTPAAAKKAHADKNGALLEGRDMRLDFAAKPAPREDRGARANDRAERHGDVTSPESDTLFVGNLSFQTNEDSVSAFFNEVAPVTSLRLPTDM